MKVEWWIEKKKRGNWRPQFDFVIKFDETPEIYELRPYFQFQIPFVIPTTFYFGTKAPLAKRGGNCYCEILYKDKTISYNLEKYIEGHCEIRPIRECSRFAMNPCQGCKAYLNWRPGANPDYSDVIDFFEKVAKHAEEAWAKALQEAQDSSAFFITSQAKKQEVLQKELVKKPSRKLKIK